MLLTGSLKENSAQIIDHTSSLGSNRSTANGISLPAAHLAKIRKFCDQMESPATMFGLDEQSTLIKETLPDTEFLKVFHLC